ncbi:MAG TPA: valine--tRNA ligase [Longimicrobiales bacterium]|nr:valine--tRNA ligase [Longimicrobiales bacterium]
MTEPLSKTYDPRAIEAPLYREWRDRGYFSASARAVLEGGRDPYVIVIPPPNVTAVLHMGHGLNNTLQDLLIRWRRMKGREALWIPGTDHAGIATQNVVERQLAEEGLTRQDVGREAFVARVWDFVERTGGRIIEQLEAIGCSFDLERQHFTLDPDLSRAVREVFVRLYEKQLIYRGNYIINWCPRCLTALSNEEAEGEESAGQLYHLRYPLPEPADAERLPGLADGRGYLVVATTRPETMLGDTAVAVHPEDERYAHLVGRMVELPLTGRQIPIVQDDWVDREFGSGAVKITPAHDPNDFELGRRHGLPEINVLTETGTMSDDVPAPFRGLDRFEARQKVVEAFEAAGLLEGVEEHTHTIPRCYRCDTVVEPRLSEQWFVKMKPLAAPALAASRDGRVRFTPDRWQKVYEHWMESIRDWCISRQLWWGHRIPVWYCEAEGCEAMIVAREDPTACPDCKGTSLRQDPDVLDTWFSSWLWPFSTMGWPDETEDLEAFYPTSTLSTAPEILFFWVARMVMAGLEFRGEVPFSDVLLHATVRDHHGRKMSKSLGNGIDPLEVVEQFGADALRYTVVAGASIGTDIHLNYENLEEAFATGRNFANKLWNAGRFALMNLGEEPVRTVGAVADDLELADRWILSRLSRTTRRVDAALESFRVHDAAEAIHGFFWGEVADWYLELIKGRMKGETGEGSREAAEATLVAVLDGVFRLLHPIMPFVTETLWRRLPWPEGVDRTESLIVAPWPAPDPGLEDDAAEASMAALQELITTVRGLRSEYDVPARAEVPVELAHVPAPLEAALAVEERSLRRLAGVGSLSRAEGGDGHRAGAHAVLQSGAELFVALTDVIDLDRERARLSEELERIENLLGSTEGRLSNRQFTARAPAEVVEREREKAESFRDQRERLSRKLAALR